jgi:hypothetical protein
VILSEYLWTSIVWIAVSRFATRADCATIAAMRARRLFLPWIPLGLLVAGAWLVSRPSRAQNPVGDLLSLINQARTRQGLHLYVVNPKLVTAAQRHSEDMASTGQINHTGSDGSTSTQRILEAGYDAYEFGLVASENIFGGTGGAELPFDAWMDDSGAQANLLHEKYREVGIGLANDDQGRGFWTLSVGAQPNVLPVLINGGITSVDTVSVTLSLTPENVVPEGRGTAMGQPVAYRASTSPEFPDAEWAPWAEQVSFMLDDTPGQQSVHVQLRDAEGRTAVSQAAVTLTGQDTITATATLTATAENETPGSPTATQPSTASASPTLTVAPSATPTGAVTATATPAPSPTASPTPTLEPTATPLPTNTRLPSATATQVPLPTASATATAMPSQSATATATRSALATSSPQAVVVVATPDLPVLEPVGGPVEEDPLALASRLAPWAVGLQIVALILGVYVALRRPSD